MMKSPEICNRFQAAYQLEQENLLKEAIDIYQDVLTNMPNDIEALQHLANCNEKINQFEAAASCYEKLTKLVQNNAEYFNLHASMLINAKRYQEAEVSVRHALEISPQFSDAYNNLGLILFHKIQYDKAEEALDQAVVINPNNYSALINSTLPLKALGKLSKAEANLKRAIQLNPNLAAAYINLGSIYREMAEVELSIETTLQALKIEPRNLLALGNALFGMSYSLNYDPIQRLNLAKKYGEVITDLTQGRQFKTWKCLKNIGHLRIGIVSGDLHEHAVAHFLKNVLMHVDHNKIQFIAYTTDNRADKATLELVPYFTEFKSIAHLDNWTAAELIHDDNINILFDLSGHTGANRLPVFAYKPAPIQISWIGYWSTTGVEQMDYFIADNVGVPHDKQHYFAEKIVYLPDTRLCYTPIKSEIPISPLPAFKNNRITFASFQAMGKVNVEVLRLWADVLKAIPNAYIRWQCQSFNDFSIQESIKNQFLDLNIALERIILLPAVSREAYLKAHHEVDVILDTFPFSGATTTCEALWMGVPTITMLGETLVSRQGASIMTAAGMSDWIVESKSLYIQKAIDVSNNLIQLANLRLGLRDQVLGSALFDGARYAKNYENLCEKIWQKDASILAIDYVQTQEEQMQEAIQAVFKMAQKHQLEGNIAEAKMLYLEILKVNPNHTEVQSRLEHLANQS